MSSSKQFCGRANDKKATSFRQLCLPRLFAQLFLLMHVLKSFAHKDEARSRACRAKNGNRFCVRTRAKTINESKTAIQRKVILLYMRRLRDNIEY